MPEQKISIRDNHAEGALFRRRAYVAMIGVCVLTLMLLGSVLTGYHYLVDGWAGIALGLGAFAVAGRLFRSTTAPGGPERPEQ